jgi:single-strand DNA-binding protein
MEKYAKTGSQLYIEGELENRSYKDSKGDQRYVTEVLVPRFSGVIRMVGSAKPKTETDTKEAESFQKQF